LALDASADVDHRDARLRAVADAVQKLLVGAFPAMLDTCTHLGAAAAYGALGASPHAARTVPDSALSWVPNEA
jgi:hypothetical protein